MHKTIITVAVATCVLSATASATATQMVSGKMIEDGSIMREDLNKSIRDDIDDKAKNDPTTKGKKIGWSNLDKRLRKKMNKRKTHTETIVREVESPTTVINETVMNVEAISSSYTIPAVFGQYEYEIHCPSGSVLLDSTVYDDVFPVSGRGLDILAESPISDQTGNTGWKYRIIGDSGSAQDITLRASCVNQ